MNGERERILVVDDEPLMRETLELGLQRDFDVFQAASGDEAVAAARKADFPVVILDLRMTGMGGIQTLRELRKIDPNQKVIILTAHQSMETAIEAVNLGAFNYLTKPCDLQRLRRLVADAGRRYAEEKGRLERFRERLVRMHDEVFSVLCHEFNTPLNGIIGLSDFLAGELESDEFREVATHIRESGRQLHATFVEIMDYLASSRPESVGPDRRFSVREIEAWIRSHDFGTGVSFFFTGGGEEPEKPLRGPGGTVRSILGKLIEAGADGEGDIRVIGWFQRKENELLLKAQVSGGGFGELLEAAGSTEDLFSPYTVASLNLTGEKRGARLHLATCRNLAETAGIRIWCDRGENGAARVWLEIPVEEAAPE